MDMAKNTLQGRAINIDRNKLRARPPRGAPLVCEATISNAIS